MVGWLLGDVWHWLSSWKLSYNITISRVYFPIYTVLTIGMGGPHLGMGKIEFDAIFDRGKCKLSDAFYGIKKYCS